MNTSTLQHRDPARFLSDKQNFTTSINAIKKPNVFTEDYFICTYFLKVQTCEDCLNLRLAEGIRFVQIRITSIASFSDCSISPYGKMSSSRYLPRRSLYFEAEVLHPKSNFKKSNLEFYFLSNVTPQSNPSSSFHEYNTLPNLP